jgi:hypothetical protein
MSPSAIPSEPQSAPSKLRSIIENPKGFVLAPGVHDGLSARIALGVGFDALYMVSTQPLFRSSTLTTSTRPAPARPPHD